MLAGWSKKKKQEEIESIVIFPKYFTLIVHPIVDYFRSHSRYNDRVVQVTFACFGISRIRALPKLR